MTNGSGRIENEENATVLEQTCAIDLQRLAVRESSQTFLVVIRHLPKNRNFNMEGKRLVIVALALLTLYKSEFDRCCHPEDKGF